MRPGLMRLWQCFDRASSTIKGESCQSSRSATGMHRQKTVQARSASQCLGGTLKAHLGGLKVLPILPQPRPWHTCSLKSAATQAIAR